MKWFSADRGYGFITPDEPGTDLFVHHSNITGEGVTTLKEGAKVSREIESDPRGPSARNVSPV